MNRITTSLGARPLAVSNPSMSILTQGSLMFARGKRTKAKKVPGRLVEMLSLYSARKKQPQRLWLAIEDQLRHNAVHQAWKYYMRDLKKERTLQLKKQYELIEEACTELAQLSPFLSFEATKVEKSKRFSPEMRVPTETPPRNIWASDWKLNK